MTSPLVRESFLAPPTVGDSFLTEGRDRNHVPAVIGINPQQRRCRNWPRLRIHRRVLTGRFTAWSAKQMLRVADPLHRQASRGEGGACLCAVA